MRTKSFFTSEPKPQQPFHRRIFEHKFGIKPLLKLVGFPLLFLREMFSDFSEFKSWGPDCASPVSAPAFKDPKDVGPSGAVLIISASAFGAMHFITWSFPMPTLTELWLWRSSSIALTALPILSPLFGVGAIHDSGKPHMAVVAQFCLVLTSICIVLHPIIRLVIVMDSAVLLRDIPDTAFRVLSWSDVIPSL